MGKYYDCESTFGFAIEVLEDTARCVATTEWYVQSKPYPVQCKRRQVDGEYCAQHARIQRRAHSASSVHSEGK